jgi:hypothetical protein
MGPTDERPTRFSRALLLPHIIRRQDYANTLACRRYSASPVSAHPLRDRQLAKISFERLAATLKVLLPEIAPAGRHVFGALRHGEAFPGRWPAIGFIHRTTRRSGVHASGRHDRPIAQQ